MKAINSLMLTRTFLWFLACSLFLNAGILYAQCLPPLPSRTGTNQDNGEVLTTEHHFMHSSTHLQGFQYFEKVSAAIHLPGQSSSLAGMRTIVIVNNPDPNLPLSVEIEYYDSTGVLVNTSTPGPIPPEGHYEEPATALTGFPWGTVRVRKVSGADPDFVGATMFHTYQIGLPSGVDAINLDLNQDGGLGLDDVALALALLGSAADSADPACGVACLADTNKDGGVGLDDVQEILGAMTGASATGVGSGEPGENVFYAETHEHRVGAASMQQLQAAQDFATELFWGPLPLTNQAAPPNPTFGSEWSWDFFNGNSPLIMVTNPNPYRVDVTISIVDTNAAVIATTVRLAPFQSYVDMTFFDDVIAAHGSNAVFDLDALVWVSAQNPVTGLLSPVIGQGVMFDLFSGSATPQNPFNQEFMGRFRMGSSMFQNTLSKTLVSPELVSERFSVQSMIATNTLLGVANASLGDIGPVLVQYRNRSGVVVGSQNIQSFPAFSTLRLGPGSPAYPIAEFAGSVTVSSCEPGLIGWNMKTTEYPGAPDNALAAGGNGFELRKAWGEALDGGNGAEPGGDISNAGILPQEKIGPLNRASLDSSLGSAPGYNHVFNNDVSNSGPYWYRFFDDLGIDLSTLTSTSPFSGLTIGSTSFTYIDGTPPLVVSVPPLQGSDFINTRFEHAYRGASGINALGGYLWKWFWYIPEPVGPSAYSGPGDVMPNL